MRLLSLLVQARRLRWQAATCLIAVMLCQTRLSLGIDSNNSSNPIADTLGQIERSYVLIGVSGGLQDGFPDHTKMDYHEEHANMSDNGNRMIKAILLGRALVRGTKAFLDVMQPGWRQYAAEPEQPLINSVVMVSGCWEHATQALQQALAAGHERGDWHITAVQKQAPSQSVVPDHIATVAPGQTIRHYAPNIPTFLLFSQANGDDPVMVHLDESNKLLLQQTVVVDFGCRLVSWESTALAYQDLSPTADSSQAAHVVFDTLRWAEQVPGATCIVLYPTALTHATATTSSSSSNNNNNNTNGSSLDDDALALAVLDRLTRAASGVVVNSLAEVAAHLQETPVNGRSRLDVC